MMKTKKNITDFQKALQSKAQFIVPDSDNVPIEIPASEEQVIDSIANNIAEKHELFEIDKEIADQLKILAEHSGRNFDELVRHALSHFLMLKGLRLRDALIERYKKDISLKDL